MFLSGVFFPSLRRHTKPNKLQKFGGGPFLRLRERSFFGFIGSMFAKLVALFLLVGCSTVLADDLDIQIRFWEKKLAQDSEDFISPTKLGELYLKKARATGDLSANVEAEKNLRLTLKKNPEHRAAIVLLASTCIAQHKFSEAR